MSRRHKRASAESAPMSRAPAMSPEVSYERVASMCKQRFDVLYLDLPGESELSRAERFALHVRKIVESVSFAALAATEVHNGQLLRDLRTRDADKLLAFLDSKKMLRMPAAQRVKPSTDPSYKLISEGNGEVDLSVKDLQGIFSRASAILHERHPERLTTEGVVKELQALEGDAAALRRWLWTHIMFTGGGEGLLVQMDMLGTSSFTTPIKKIEDLPKDLPRSL